jgi:hypothetical protein
MAATRRHVSVPDHLWKQFRKIAIDRGITLQELIEEAISGLIHKDARAAKRKARREEAASHGQQQ